MPARLGLCLLLCLLTTTAASAAERERDAFDYARLIGRGVNLGNALEAPREGEWGVTLKEDYFRLIKQAGFDSVRLPVRWSSRAQKTAPYTVDAKSFERVDWAIEQALKNKLVIIVNMHHYDEIFSDPDAHEERFLAIWKQIAERYKNQPDTVYFELLNEPHNKLTDERWNALFPKALAEIRRTNPRRPVVIGGSQWNSLHNLDKMQLPEDDRYLIGTFHYYLPFPFTHQEAHWVQGSQQWKGRRWPHEAKEVEEMQRHFAQAAEWSQREQRPVYMGEFGAFSAADMGDRVQWTQAVVAEAKKHNIPWAYWEFCAGFGFYDPQQKTWREPLLKALVDDR